MVHTRDLLHGRLRLLAERVNQWRSRLAYWAPRFLPPPFVCGPGPAAIPEQRDIVGANTFGSTFDGVIARIPANELPGPLTQLTGAIVWGDGSITQATLSAPTSNTTEVAVSGIHTYWTAGRIPIVMTITNEQTGEALFLNGQAVIASRHAGLRDIHPGTRSDHRHVRLLALFAHMATQMAYLVGPALM